MTYELWANRLVAPVGNLVDITELNDEQIETLKAQNPEAKFYFTTSGKRFMGEKGTSNKTGFFTKVFLTPVTLVVDGIVITIYAVISGGRG